MAHSPEDQRRLAFIHSVRNQISQRIGKCTCPILTYKDGAVGSLGTGILLQIGDRSFVITAAHVLDNWIECEKRQLPVFMMPGVIGVKSIPLHYMETMIVRTALPECGDRDNDMFDYGFIELKPDAADLVRKYRTFLNRLDLDFDNTFTPERRYIVVGYPKAGLNPNVEKRHLDYNPLTYVSKVYQGSRGEVPNRHEWDIVLVFDHENSINDEGNPSIPMNPKGISGCGIWSFLDHVDRYDSWSPEMVRLVGIEHTWYPQYHVLRGTKLAMVTDAIAKHVPQLRNVWGLSYHVTNLITC